MIYDPTNWYWIVADDGARVYSSSTASYQPVTYDPYQIWLAAGNVATRIDSEVSLQDVLAQQYPAGWPPTLAQQASALVAAGLTVTSESTPALSGTYACDAATTNAIQAEIVSVLLTENFADGTQSVAWPDASGALHTFSIPQFKTLAIAVAAFVAACAKAINGSSTTLPPASATIA